MVSIRCKTVIKDLFNTMGLHTMSINLGEAEVLEELSVEQLQHIQKALLLSGLELMDDKNAILIERIKNVIVELIHYTDEIPKIKFSEFLHEKLQYDYTYMANLFSETEGTTIEQYIILHKIERAKELILYNELNLTEIAWKLHYSSVAHLSNQFKKVTGLTPSFFKALKHKKRTTLDKV